MTVRCPFCEAVHPVLPKPVRHTLACPCGATAWLCTAGTEPETAVRMDAMGFRETFADVIDDRVSIVWARERQWWTQHQWGKKP